MRAYSLAQGTVEGVHRPVTLGGGDDPLALDQELDRRLGGSLTPGPFFGDDPESLQLEEGLSITRSSADEQRERGVGRLVMVALVLPLLYRREHAGYVS